VNHDLTVPQRTASQHRRAYIGVSSRQMSTSHIEEERYTVCYPIVRVVRSSVYAGALRSDRGLERGRNRQDLAERQGKGMGMRSKEWGHGKAGLCEGISPQYCGKAPTAWIMNPAAQPLLATPAAVELESPTHEKPLRRKCWSISHQFESRTRHIAYTR